MKVRDLIRQLEQHPPDAFIIVIDDDGGGYDCAHYLDGVVEPITVEDTPYRNEGPPDYKMIYGKPWQETVLAIRGRRYLWDVSHELFEAGHSGNPFEEGGEPNDQ